MKHTVEGILQVPRELLVMRDQMAYDTFKRWVEDELHISFTSARNFINVARSFARTPLDDPMFRLDPSALYMVAATENPADARAREVLSEGRALDLKGVKDVLAGFKRQKAIDRRSARSGQLGLAGPSIVLATAVLAQIDATMKLPIEGDANLIVTSPPCKLDKPYREGEGEAIGWVPFMRDWLRRPYEAAADGCRLAINVPFDTTRGRYRPTFLQAVDMALVNGWLYRTTIVADEGNVSKATARGSVDLAGSPHVIAPAESIAILYKGEWGREAEPAQPPSMWAPRPRGVI